MILITTNWTMYEPGGVPTHIQSLQKTLQSKNISHYFTNPDERFRSLYWKTIAFVRAFGSIDRGRINISKYRINNLSTKIHMIITKESCSLIHCHDVLSCFAAIHFGVPIILTVHGPLLREVRMLYGDSCPQFNEFVRECEHLAYMRADAIIAVDTGQRDIMVQEYGVPPEKIKVIFNAVDTDYFKPSLSEKPSTPFLLVPRRLVKKNGVEVAVQAFSLLKDLSLELWIAGEGPERLNLEKSISANDLEDKVRFLGSVSLNEIAQLINRSLGVIIPSVPSEGVVEATSLAALEGMSSGKPVFASDIGGLAEIIMNGDTGFLFPAGDFEGLASLIRCMYNSQHDIQFTGQRAREYVIKKHSLNSWIEKVTQVYQSVLS